MSESTLSRRISEFAGVALFALALIWLISLVTYEPSDPVWFFTTDAAQAPANFVGRVGAFLAELSFQLFGYASYLLPLVIGIIGWHYFWCQPPDAAYTKLVGVTLFFGCASGFLSLLLGTTDLPDKTFQAGGSIGTWLNSAFSDYLNRTGSIIVLLTLMTLSVILSTQFSFGRLFARASQESRDLSARGIGWARLWLERRRKERERRNVIAKHVKTRDPGSGSPGSVGIEDRGSRNCEFGISCTGSRVPDNPGARNPSCGAQGARKRTAACGTAKSRLRDGRVRSRCRPRRCSIRRRQSARSTSGNSWKQPVTSKKSATSFPSRDKSLKSIRAPWSRRSSSSPRRGSSTAR